MNIDSTPFILPFPAVAPGVAWCQRTCASSELAKLRDVDASALATRLRHLMSFFRVEEQKVDAPATAKRVRNNAREWMKSANE